MHFRVCFFIIISVIPGLHCEAVGFVCDALLKAGSVSAHTCGVAALHHRHFEGALGDGNVLVQDLNQMDA